MEPADAKSARDMVIKSDVGGCHDQADNEWIEIWVRPKPPLVLCSACAHSRLVDFIYILSYYEIVMLVFEIVCLMEEFNK